jgi:hypothetical protein
MSNTVQKEPGNTTPNYPTYLNNILYHAWFCRKTQCLPFHPSTLPTFPSFLTFGLN